MGSEFNAVGELAGTNNRSEFVSRSASWMCRPKIPLWKKSYQKARKLTSGMEFTQKGLCLAVTVVLVYSITKVLYSPMKRCA